MKGLYHKKAHTVCCSRSVLLNVHQQNYMQQSSWQQVVVAQLASKSPPKWSFRFNFLIYAECLFLISHMHGTSPYCTIRPSIDYVYIIIIIIIIVIHYTTVFLF
jgi:hypothetical protein